MLSLRPALIQKIQWLAVACAVVLFLSAIGLCQGEPESKFDPASLIGQWKYGDGLRAGAPASDENLAQTVVIDKNKFFVTGDNQEFEIEYTINADKDPIQIDMAITSGPAPEDTKAQGIFKFADGKLTLCYDPSGATRPTKFESTEANGFHMFELTRVAFDAAQLKGNWKYESGKRVGTDIPAERLQTIVAITEDKFTVPAGPEDEFIMSYKLDTAQIPVAIDLKIESGPAPEGTALGIIKLDGDKLVLCYDPSGANRPKEFESTEDNGCFLFVLSKQPDNAEKKD
jgi:uncharacterized protein (TIGR03067 family)